MEYEPIIGLEVHAELKTRTKMFCASLNDPDETRPNVNICPVCMAHPGTLPVINRQAVHHVLRVGTAVGGALADFTEFDRKNYFYPDIPKGYQISQYKYPLVSGGELAGVALTRIHLEEDTARSSHEMGDGLSHVDFNRAGVPLMELVTEPVIRSATRAGMFARELQLLLRTLGASEANLEKGEMRVEANISVSNVPGTFGTKVEVKNLNSFKSVERAIDYEIRRHIEVLRGGGTIVQETRGWNEESGKTFSQRKKESSHDYRYFPDPDLPKLWIKELPEFAELKASLPELPWERRTRFTGLLGLKPEIAETLVQDMVLGQFFDRVAAVLGASRDNIQKAGNYITSDIVGLSQGDSTKLTIDSTEFADLIRMIGDNELSSRGAKDVLARMWSEGGSPRMIAEAEGLLQKSDAGQIEAIAKQVIAENEAVVAEYKAGKVALLQFFVGQGMKASKGSANPGLLAEAFKKLLS